MTVDEIGPDDSGRQLATLVTDDGISFQLPVELLPDETRANDVLTLLVEPDPAETRRRGKRIENLQHRLFGNR